MDCCLVVTVMFCDARMASFAEELDGAVPYTACWGAELHGGGGCLPNFVPGKLHFKNNFCDNCRDLIVVPLAQVCALSAGQAACFVNKFSKGFWNDAPAHLGGGQYRIINNTAGCIGPWLAIFREEPPHLAWSAPPRDRTLILTLTLTLTPTLTCTPQAPALSPTRAWIRTLSTLTLDRSLILAPLRPSPLPFPLPPPSLSPFPLDVTVSPRHDPSTSPTPLNVSGRTCPITGPMTTAACTCVWPRGRWCPPSHCAAANRRPARPCGYP